MPTNAIITAYCACHLCCGPDAAGLTASGTRPVAGRTIAAPRHVPFGTQVTIDGHTYTVEDRTAKRYNGRYDIYFSTHAAALRYGKRTAAVTISPRH